MPGGPRKPTKLHVLHGTGKKNPKRMAARAAEPKITAPVGDPPAYLKEIGRAKWFEIAGDPEYGQVLNRSHRETLEHYCVLYERFVADAKNEKDMKASDRQTFHSLAMQLGRTPAAQSKVSVPQAKPVESPWDKVANK